jgi:hypothetical protein
MCSAGHRFESWGEALSDLSTDFDQKNTNHLQACFNPTSSRFQSPHHPCNHTVICLLMSVSSTKKIKKSGISPRNVKNLTQGCFVCIRSYRLGLIIVHCTFILLYFGSCPLIVALCLTRTNVLIAKFLCTATNGSEFQLLLFSVFHRWGRNAFKYCGKNVFLKVSIEILYNQPPPNYLSLIKDNKQFFWRDVCSTT